MSRRFSAVAVAAVCGVLLLVPAVNCVGASLIRVGI